MYVGIYVCVTFVCMCICVEVYWSMQKVVCIVLYCIIIQSLQINELLSMNSCLMNITSPYIVFTFESVLTDDLLLRFTNNTVLRNNASNIAFQCNVCTNTQFVVYWWCTLLEEQFHWILITTKCLYYTYPAHQWSNSHIKWMVPRINFSVYNLRYQLPLTINNTVTYYEKRKCTLN